MLYPCGVAFHKACIFKFVFQSHCKYKAVENVFKIYRFTIHRSKHVYKNAKCKIHLYRRYKTNIINYISRN